MTHPYRTAGDWTAWLAQVSEPGPGPVRTWALRRDGVVVARGSGRSQAECRRAAGAAYRQARRLAVRGEAG
jgi:hypothetical protein